MAAMWEARDRVLDRPVAVKILDAHLATDPDIVARFQREQSPPVAHASELVATYDTGSEGGLDSSVMELVEGRTCATYSTPAASSHPTAVDIAPPSRRRTRLCARARHRSRDVQPANIVVRADGCVKLADFGIAAPDTVPDAPADITGLGLVLDEMLAGPADHRPAPNPAPDRRRHRPRGHRGPGGRFRNAAEFAPHCATRMTWTRRRKAERRSSNRCRRCRCGSPVSPRRTCRRCCRGRDPGLFALFAITRSHAPCSARRRRALRPQYRSRRRRTSTRSAGRPTANIPKRRRTPRRQPQHGLGDPDLPLERLGGKPGVGYGSEPRAVVADPARRTRKRAPVRDGRSLRGRTARRRARRLGPAGPDHQRDRLPHRCPLPTPRLAATSSSGSRAFPDALRTRRGPGCRLTEAAARRRPRPRGRRRRPGGPRTPPRTARRPDFRHLPGGYRPP